MIHFYDADELKQLEELQKKHPALMLNKRHPSITLATLSVGHEEPSTFYFEDFEDFIALLRWIHKTPSYQRISNTIGQEMYTEDLFTLLVNNTVFAGDNLIEPTVVLETFDRLKSGDANLKEALRDVK